MSNISLSFDNSTEQIKSVYDNKIKILTEELDNLKKINMARIINNQIGGMINNSDNCKQNIEMNNLNSNNLNSNNFNSNNLNNINEEPIIDENFININILSSIEKPYNFNLIKLLIDNICNNLDFYINEDIVKYQLRDYLFFCIKQNIGNFKNKCINCINCNTKISKTNSTGLCGNFFCQNQFNYNFNKNFNYLNNLNKKFNKKFNP